MRILYILPFVPWPVRVRSFNLIPRLARRHEIYLVCLSGSEEEEAHLNGLGGACRKVEFVRHRKLEGAFQSLLALPTPTPLRMAYCHSAAMERAVRKTLAEAKPDIIYVERWRALQWVPAERTVPVICDPTDSMTLYNRRLIAAGAWWERILGTEEYLKFLGYEPKLAERADVTVFCSRHDLECARRNSVRGRYALVPNGVDCRKYSPKPPGAEDPHTIIFTGSFKYAPNRRAAEFFTREVFPLVRRAIPPAKFLIVGNHAARYFDEEMQGRTEYKAIDFVPDLLPYLRKATVAVAPITIGAGVSNKILEAFATGTPMVATPMACGDLPVRDGEHLLVAGKPEDFAEKVIRLIEQPELRRRLAASARELVERHNDWEMIASRLEQLMLDLVQGEFSHQEEEPVFSA